MQAKRRFGQNFLVGDHYPQRIVNALAPRPGETIVEIGPGYGALTRLLADSGARVVAIELDDELIPALRQLMQGYDNFELRAADALSVDYCEIIAPAETARVAANLPYNAATPILQRLLLYRSCLNEMVLMFQREVAERITAQPGTRQYGYLSVLTQFYCEVEKLFDVPPGTFRPAPKVVSSVLRLRVLKQPAAFVRDEQQFLSVVSALFAQRRKTMLNNLKAACGSLQTDAQSIVAAIARAGLSPGCRAERLAISEIARLADALQEVREAAVR